MAEEEKTEKLRDGSPLNEVSNYSAPSEVSAESLTLPCVSVSPQPAIETKTTAEPEVPAIHVLSDIIIQKYEGGRSGELLHGEGVAYFTGGHVYKGSFVDGLMNGYGEYTWVDGLKYKGDFKSNVPTGHGKYTWLDCSTYEGEVCNGICHGTGTYTSVKTCTIYKGQWYKGKRHGKGAMYFNQEATSWYEGDWENNRREGWGKRCYPTGDTYEGQWENSVRHGEGTMKWIRLGQQYSGEWLNGVQHGHGTHTWFHLRITGSQYPMRNEYTGTFFQGLRHGQGTFVYASGAVYTGSWKDNKKHGQGKFVFKNGRVYDGEFINDRMVGFPASSTVPLLPCNTEESGNHASLLGPEMELNIDNLLNRIPETQRKQELRQVEFAIKRYISLLRSIYSAYSSLGHENSPDNTFLLSKLQFWRFLKDCSVHQHGLTLAMLDRLINKDISPGEVYSPFSSVLPSKWISCIVIAAYHVYHRDFESSSYILAACFSKTMKQNIMPNAKNVKGPLYCRPLRAAFCKHYTERCWEIYQTVPKVILAITSDIMTARHFIWMFKVLNLFDGTITTRRLLEILSLENPAIYNSTYSNLDLEINFLEFFEALLCCAEINTRDVGVALHDLDFPAETSSSGQIKNSSISSQPSYLQHYETELSSSTTISSSAISEFQSKATAQSARPGEIQYDEDEEGHAEEQLKGWVDRVHQFFTHIFIRAYEHNLLWRKEMQEEQNRRSADIRITLETAKANAKLGEQQRAEEVKSKESEEISKEKMKADEMSSPTAPTTPVTSSHSVGFKQSLTKNKKKKK